MPKSNWALFKISLSRHPGLSIGCIWPFMCLMAILLRADFDQLPQDRVIFSTLLLCALPWIPILCTAWTGRHQYQDEDEQP